MRMHFVSLGKVFTSLRLARKIKLYTAPLLLLLHRLIVKSAIKFNVYLTPELPIGAAGVKNFKILDDSTTKFNCVT